jgi:2-polyprenyl-3-methyl-5-hydroxy-6-metoxy-1,4-benzoquinol methylase
MQCPTCDIPISESRYLGPIRTGRPGRTSDTSHRVDACTTCGLAFLDLDTVDYSDDGYRKSVDGERGFDDFAPIHDWEQASLLAVIGTAHLHGMRIVDVGCGGGRFLDLVGRFSGSETVAIEPSVDFESILRAKGNHVFRSIEAACVDYCSSMDLAVSFDVIEHVKDPVAFAKDIGRLMRPGGRVVIGTPNLDQILLRLLPEDFGRFFFRRVHRWYFSPKALRMCLEAAGLSNVSVRSIQRFDFSNIALWLRDRAPTGIGREDFPKLLTTNLAAALEATDLGEYLVAEANVQA